jgi:hypothetical protein
MKLTFEERSAQSRQACENMGAEVRSNRLRKGWANRDRSAQAEVMRRVNEAKPKKPKKEVSEARRAAGIKAWETRQRRQAEMGDS